MARFPPADKALRCVLPYMDDGSKIQQETKETDTKNPETKETESKKPDNTKESKEEKKNDSVKTGDRTPIAICFMMFGVSLVSMVVVLFARKRR